jgi:hypothetical protein
VVCEEHRSCFLQDTHFLDRVHGKALQVPYIPAISSEAMARQGSTNYMAGKRMFAPWTGKTHTRVFRKKKSGGQGFSWSITRVDTKRAPAVNFSY